MTSYEKALKIGNVDIGFGKIPVAVLKDGTRLITTSGFHKALGRASPSGKRSKELPSRLPSFLRSHALNLLITEDLIASLQPIHFMMPRGGKAIGYKAEMLPKVCELFLKARDAGILTEKQLNYASSADLIMRGLAHVGIIALVDEATGYQEFRDKTALQAILDKYLCQEAAKWAKTFPDSFYHQIIRLKKWKPCKQLQHKTSNVGLITQDLVYKRMATGLLDVLEERNPKNEYGKRKTTHHQWLSKEQGVHHLKGHIFMLEKLMKACNSWEDFMKKVEFFLPYPQSEEIEI